MNTLFISDLHLHESRPQVTRAFLDFIKQQATQAQALYILGDLFEMWVGDDNDTPLIRDIINALKQLSNSNTATYIMHGNRDFTLGQQFCQQTGCQLIQDPSVIELYGRPVLLMHGDNLCTSDTEYLAFRAQVRNPQWQALMLTKPLQERLALAQQLRNSSKEANSNKAEDIMDVTPSEIQRVMQEHQTDLLIHGHTHRPAIHHLSEGKTRIVLGDWDDLGWSLNMQANGNYDLNSFSIR